MESMHNNLVGYLVYDTQRAIAKSLEATLKPYDITPGQWNLINQLDHAGQMTQKELAKATQKEQATITRYLDTLERKGLVVRTQHKTDRRSHIVSVTNKAHDLIENVFPLTIDAAESLVEGLSQEDLEKFQETLAAIKKNANEIAGEHGED